MKKNLILLFLFLFITIYFTKYKYKNKNEFNNLVSLKKQMLTSNFNFANWAESNNMILRVPVHEKGDKLIQFIQYSKDFKNFPVNESEKKYNKPYLYGKIGDFCDIYSNKVNDIFKNDKIYHRYICFYLINYIRNFEIPILKKNNKYEAVLIEFRKFPHLEFLIRNTILKLGNKDWSYTIVCGIENYDYLLKLSNKISPEINVIRTEYDNLQQSDYSRLLSSASFWNMFSGEKILIYQEDTIVFRKGIDKFMEYDYIGAPWPKNQNDNSLCVGNGGFSLRSKKIMLEIISKIKIEDTIFNSSTLEYMKNTGQTVGPEDVYFTLNMLKYNVGKIADWETASEFSSELIFNENTFAGHNYWLSIPNFKNYLYRFTKTLGVATRYGISTGGGEYYLLSFCKYFIDNHKTLVFLFITHNHFNDKYLIYNTIKDYLGEEYIDYFIIIHYDDMKFFENNVDYFFTMENTKYPSRKNICKLSSNSFYHCQFPFDSWNTNSGTQGSLLENYNNIIVNSEFTRDHYLKYTAENSFPYQKQHIRNIIKILYPPCIKKINDIKYVKKENSFVMIGRIFNYSEKAANNKNFDIALKIFSKIEKIYGTSKKFSITVIGSVKHKEMFEKLKSFESKNIHILPNLPEEDKIKIMKESKYFINLVGLGRSKKDPYAYEHFGMAIIEAINYGCIPISVDGGYPAYYINDLYNGFIVEDSYHLEEVLKKIIENEYNLEYQGEFYRDLLSKFTYESYERKLTEILNKKQEKGIGKLYKII
jgi:hypothetical protein